MIIPTSSGMELRFTGAQQGSGIEEELKVLRQSTAALHEAVTKDSRAIEKTLESHSAAIGSVRAALSQNEELVEGIVETLQMLNGVSEDLAEEPLAAAS
jgi:phosphoenolpyruvate-protein kinase (PTS system EI component)